VKRPGREVDHSPFTFTFKTENYAASEKRWAYKYLCTTALLTLNTTPTVGAHTQLLLGGGLRDVL
jgi:hypothetical protein